MSGAGDSQNESTSSSEDEEPYIDETRDKHFFKTLSCLKNKDPKIYDPNVVFFPNDEEDKGEVGKKKNNKDRERPLYLRDYERELVVKAMKGEDGKVVADAEDNETNEEDLPYALQQKSLKESFKATLNSSDSEDEGGLFTVKQKTVQDRIKEEEEYKAWLKGNKDELSDKEIEQDLKPLHSFWNKPDLDPNEQFLRDYILNRKYLEEGEGAEDDGISEDGELLEMQEQFETNYNMRFETESNTEVRRYPRSVEGSLRRKDESRKKKRQQKKERKRLEKEQKKEEIAKTQKQKLMEFKNHVEKMKKLTGNDQLGFRDDEIFGEDEFDPEKHDKKMQELYSDAFYAAGEGEMEKPDFSNEEQIGEYEDEDNMDWNEDLDCMDLDAPTTSSRAKTNKKETRSKKKRKEKRKAFTDILDVVKPVYDPKVHNSFQKYIDEYYAVDCEDFIEDLPCKFKYREVVPNDYGLSVEEILAADDKDLNQWVSAKKIIKLRPEHVEKNEVKIYRQKGQNFNLKKKILSSIYGSPKAEDDEEDTEKLENIEKSEVLEGTSRKELHNEGLTVSKKKTNKKRSDRAEIEEVEQNGDSCELVPKKKRKKDNLVEGNGKNIIQNIKKPTAKMNTSKSDNQTKQNGSRDSFRKGGQNKRKKELKKKKNDDSVIDVSDLRLKAYDIKPREFKKKLKFKEQ